MQNREISI